jgi:deazaflavin-dependent oxidoreductase (nitroreductase family)
LAHLAGGAKMPPTMAMPLLFKLFVKGHVALYQASGGRLGSKMRGMDVLLLTTTGKKTGQARTVPVVPFVENGETYVIASMGGAPQNPAWYTNHNANPEVGVQVGPSKWKAKAEALEGGAERDRLWGKITALMPNFADYQKKTTRVIPVVHLVKQT